MTTKGSDSGTIRFLLDGEYHDVTGIRPTTTVLQYLREHLHRCGTKEGCAEGDCGACTVVLAELVENRVRFRAANSCIQFLPTIDGKALFTVESLKGGSNGDLHPVQQALVECHGSQCGFCTPGFVMSLFALYKTIENPGLDEVQFALAGNLCRCTGYRPIVAAAKRMYELKTDAKSVDNTQLKKQLEKIRVTTGKQVTVDNFRYVAPVTVQELSAFLSKMPDATILAGGTDVGLWVTKQHEVLTEIVYIGNVAELDSIRRTDDMIEIGAAVALTDAFAALMKEYPDLYEIVRRFASPPICNNGTLCGNVANGSPIGDSMPALISLGAEVVLRNGSHSRSMPLENFYIDYQRTDLKRGEFVETVRIPRARSETNFRSYKSSKRYDQDISAVCAAFSIELKGDIVQSARVCFGGMAPTPRRATACEQALKGAKWLPGSIDKAVRAMAEDFDPMTDCRATDRFRTTVAGNLLRRFYTEVSEPGSNTSVWNYEA